MLRRWHKTADAHFEVNRTENRFSAIGCRLEPSETVEIQLFFGGEALFPTPSAKTADGDGAVTELFIAEPGDPHVIYTVTASGESCYAETQYEFLPDTATDAAATADSRAFNMLFVLAAGFATFVYLVTRAARSGLRHG